MKLPLQNHEQLLGCKVSVLIRHSNIQNMLLDWNYNWTTKTSLQPSKEQRKWGKAGLFSERTAQICFISGIGGT
jgi:hypothetical protein